MDLCCGLFIYFDVCVWVVVVWFSDKLFILLAKTSTVKKILELETKILELGKYHPLLSGEGVSAYEDSKKIDMLQYCCVFTRKSHFCDENVKIYKVPLYILLLSLFCVGTTN